MLLLELQHELEEHDELLLQLVLVEQMYDDLLVELAEMQQIEPPEPPEPL
jgi:hypothetical protein